MVYVIGSSPGKASTANTPTELPASNPLTINSALSRGYSASFCKAKVVVPSILNESIRLLMLETIALILILNLKPITGSIPVSANRLALDIVLKVPLNPLPLSKSYSAKWLGKLVPCTAKEVNPVHPSIIHGHVHVMLSPAVVNTTAP